MSKRQIREQRREKQRLRDKIVNADFAELETRVLAAMQSEEWSDRMLQSEDATMRCTHDFGRGTEDTTFEAMYGVQRCPQE